MSFYFSPSSKLKFKGGPRMTLPLTINRDLIRSQSFCNIKERFVVCSFKSLSDLNKLADIASDRKHWINLSKDIYIASDRTGNIG